MTHRTALRCTLAFFAALLLSVSASAQLFRSYLAPNGSDSNPCTLPQPCRLLPAALNAVANGGEIWMLDSANYNTATVTISKSVSILAVPGAVGSVLAIAGPAISITAAGLNVALRNLAIVPLAGGGGSDGINMTGVSRLTIEGSLIANLPGDGVSVTGAGKLDIASTIIRNNGGFAVTLLNGTTASVSGANMVANSAGGVRAGNTNGTVTIALVSDSIVSAGTEGIVASATTPGGSLSRVSVTRSSIQNTGTGLVSTGSGLSLAEVVVSNSMVTNNNSSFSQTGSAAVRSLGNNHLYGNFGSTGSLTATAPE
jgi:hypothetical protein